MTITIYERHFCPVIDECETFESGVEDLKRMEDRNECYAYGIIDNGVLYVRKTHAFKQDNVKQHCVEICKEKTLAVKEISPNLIEL